MSDGDAAELELRRRKAELRRRLRAVRDGLSGRDVLSARIGRQLYGLLLELRPRTVHSFVPMGSEVDLLPLLRQLQGEQLRIAVPVLSSARGLSHSWVTGFSDDDWRPAPFGTQAPRMQQPLAAAEITALDVVLVPLLGFNHALFRIGYGGGYYDRFLLQTQARRIGVAFACQYVDDLPLEPHDLSLDAVVTEATLFQASERVTYHR